MGLVYEHVSILEPVGGACKCSSKCSIFKVLSEELSSHHEMLYSAFKLHLFGGFVDLVL